MRFFTLLLLSLWSHSLYADSTQKLAENLRSRLVNLSPKSTLIRSYTNHTQSYIYDQALAIITFTQEKDLKRATELLSGMEELQLPDGSLYFSYYLDGKSPYPKEGDKRYAGAIAWVALAASHYQHQFKKKDFVNFNFKILTYLKNQLHQKSDYSAIKFAPQDISSTPWRENETAALEHNVDAYAAFKMFRDLNGSDEFKNEIQGLSKFITSLWDKEKGHFWSGMNLKENKINKEEYYLDNQTWTLLALDEAEIKQLNAASGLELNCQKLKVKHENIEGFMDRRPASYPSKYKFVWSEGTAGQILAMKKVKSIGQEKICPGVNADRLILEIEKMSKEDGGIAYSTSGGDPDFSTASSVAGTAWYYFTLNNLNPFALKK